MTRAEKATNKNQAVASLAAIVVFSLLSAIFAGAAQAQSSYNSSYGYGSSANSYAPYSNSTTSGVNGYTDSSFTTTNKTPLITGAYSTAPGMAAYQGAPPAVGCGSMTPPSVTPGMTGSPTLLPWNTNVPVSVITSSTQQTVSLPYDNTSLMPPGTLGPALAGSVPTAPSTPGTDPGTLPGPPSFKAPPAAVVNVQSGGGMPGDQAPQTRWGGQTTQDFGLTRITGSQTTDFGQPLSQTTNLQKTPQYSQDGPRQATYPGVIGQVNRTSNLSGAQVTQDLYGRQTAFKGTSNLPQQTIAPF